MPVTLYRDGTFFLYDSNQTRVKPNLRIKADIEPDWKNLNIKFEEPEPEPPNDPTAPRPFRLTTRQKATYISRCLVMEEFKKDNLKTFVLTYGSPSVENTKKDLNTFLTRCRRDFKFNSYAWTLELTDKKQFHYHFIVDSPFLEIPKFNKAWCSTRGYFSKNGIRQVEQVRGIIEASDYATKKYKIIKKAGEYFSKTEQYKLEGIGQRLYATSNKVKHLNLSMVGSEKEVIRDSKTIDYILKDSLWLDKKQFFVKGFLPIRKSMELLNSMHPDFA